MSDDRLDIVIPVYNEGENILSVLDSLNRFVKTPFRVIICYDHDTDTTLRTLEISDTSGIEYVPVKNQGVGVHGAVMTGFHFSTAPAVTVIPADDDYNAQIIDKMYSAFKSGGEIVVASRFMEGGSMVGCPFMKSVLVRTVAFTLHHLARLPATDPTNGFRLFSRRALEVIPVESTQGFTYSIELLVKAHRLGWPIRTVAAKWIERSKGESRFRILKWAGSYLKWYFYPFATTWLGRRSVNGVT